MRRRRSPSTAVTADVVIAIGLCGLGLVEVFGWWDLGGIGAPKPTASRLIEAVLVVLATVSLTWRRSHPVSAVACTAATLAVQLVVVTPSVSLVAGLLPLLVLNFSVATYATWPGRIAGLALTLGAQGVFTIVIPEERVPNEFAFGVIVILGSWLIGIALRRRLERVDTVIAEARRRAAEQHASTLADERTRIARELHDVIAHGVSVMGVQSAAARLVLDREPDSAKQILLAVEGQARESIAELQRLLSVLRSTENSNDRQPQPGLDNLPRLVQTMRIAGLQVDLVNHGTPQRLPPGADLAAYRIVQEALTNALKHAGPVTAQVDFRWSADQLSIDVSDHGTRVDAALRPGHGLVGMRERAALYGGTVRVGARPAGGIFVTAELPLGAAAQ